MATKERQSYGAVVLSLVRTATLLLIFVAQALNLMFTATMMNWLPSYFHRTAGMEITTASLVGAMYLIGNAVGSLATGPLLDWLRGRSAVRALYWQMCACFVGFFMLLAGFGLVEPGSATQVALLIGSTLFTMSLVNLGYTVTADLSLPRQRGTAISLLITTQNIFGMAVGPLLTGALSDHFDLHASLLVMTGLHAVAGVLYVAVSLTYNRDFARLDQVVVEF